MEAIIFSATTFFSTFFGGLFAVKFRHKLHLIMGFTAGVLLGVVAFDILPKIIDLVKKNNFNVREVMIALVLGFLVFHILEKFLIIHHSHEGLYVEHKHPHVGVLSATALIGHSFMDGMGIGLGFQVSQGVGVLVALAVISHDFTDGMNTITMMLNSNNTDAKSKLFLLFDALAPVLGALSTLLFVVSPHFLVLYLGFFAGFLLYIGASDILPEAHSKNSSATLIFLTIFGVAVVFVITSFI